MTNKIKDYIQAQETAVFKFVPNPEFYNKVGIKRKRWAQIYRAEKDPTLTELKSIASYFNISPECLFDLK